MFQNCLTAKQQEEILLWKWCRVCCWSSNCIVLFSGWIIWWKWRLCVVQSSQTAEWAQIKTRRGEVNIKSRTPLWTGAALNYYAKYYTNDYTPFKKNNFNTHKSLRSASRVTESVTVKNRKRKDQQWGEGEKREFTEKAWEHRCDSLTRLLAIVCSDSSNGKKWQVRRERWNVKDMEPK